MDMGIIRGAFDDFETQNYTHSTVHLNLYFEISISVLFPQLHKYRKNFFFFLESTYKEDIEWS